MGATQPVFRGATRDRGRDAPAQVFKTSGVGRDWMSSCRALGAGQRPRLHRRHHGSVYTVGGNSGSPTEDAVRRGLGKGPLSLEGGRDMQGDARPASHDCRSVVWQPVASVTRSEFTGQASNGTHHDTRTCCGVKACDQATQKYLFHVMGDVMMFPEGKKVYNLKMALYPSLPSIE